MQFYLNEKSIKIGFVNLDFGFTFYLTTILYDFSIILIIWFGAIEEKAIKLF